MWLCWRDRAGSHLRSIQNSNGGIPTLGSRESGNCKCIARATRGACYLNFEYREMISIIDRFDSNFPGRYMNCSTQALPAGREQLPAGVRHSDHPPGRPAQETPMIDFVLHISANFEHSTRSEGDDDTRLL
jgi:hypothetical protein